MFTATRGTEKEVNLPRSPVKAHQALSRNINSRHITPDRWRGVDILATNASNEKEHLIR